MVRYKCLFYLGNRVSVINDVYRGKYTRSVGVAMVPRAPVCVYMYVYLCVSVCVC